MQSIDQTKTTVERCSGPDCKKKLKLTDMNCKCNKRFCQLHRLPETHNCGFDHKTHEWSQLVNKLFTDQTTSTKVIPI